MVSDLKTGSRERKGRRRDENCVVRARELLATWGCAKLWWLNVNLERFLYEHSIADQYRRQLANLGRPKYYAQLGLFGFDLRPMVAQLHIPHFPRFEIPSRVFPPSNCMTCQHSKSSIVAHIICCSSQSFLMAVIMHRHLPLSLTRWNRVEGHWFGR
jgi:hypothetical protein